jgi:hypothetical protein
LQYPRSIAFAFSYYLISLAIISATRNTFPGTFIR